ncbi:MAG: hypothetical protein ACXAC5_00075 [Promethearchaeota archaeon]|jgi:hypothetical protein
MALTITFPTGSRATRITQSNIPGDAVSTHWQLASTPWGTFTIISTTSGTDSANVLDSGLDTLDIWLPPSGSYTIRTRHALADGSNTAWTLTKPFTSRGPLNSFEKYQALSGLGGVDNIITE